MADNNKLAYPPFEGYETAYILATLKTLVVGYVVLSEASWGRANPVQASIKINDNN